MPLHFCVTYDVLLAPSDIMSFIQSLQRAAEETNGPPGAITTDAADTNNTTSRSDTANTRPTTHSTKTITPKTKKNSMMKYYFHVLGFIGVTYVLLHCTLSHPFLLSDNR